MLQAAPMNFVGDQLCAIDPVGDYVIRIYSRDPEEPTPARDDPRNVGKVVDVMREVFADDRHAWVDVLPVTDRLWVLRGDAGLYDFVWADLREGPPPPATKVDRFDIAAWKYFQHGVWLEKVEHEAELYWYANGGGHSVYPGLDSVLQTYLTDHGLLG